MESVVNDNVMIVDEINNSEDNSCEEDSEAKSKNDVDGDTMIKKKRMSSNPSISDDKIERKKTSYVWDHFQKTNDPNKVECNYCGKCIAFKPSNGISGMKNHITRCKRFPANLNRKQNLADFESKTITSPGGTSKTVKVPRCWQFDQDNCRKALARMLIVDELPFVFTEHEGFRYFCKQLCPEFVPPSRTTVTRDCYSIFIEERSELKDLLSKLSSRVCLTTDTWISGQNLGYMCLTAHFIDDRCTLHKKIIKFCPIPGHSGEIIGKSIEKCLNEWNLRRILTITIDNARSNDVSIQYLRRRITH
ncbi:DAYSLEEPER [Hibiscus trionum]|uniref:DAYSLEEPER n=1 Tax=Hibiscus trionum TaxID=183268 RepID=A0A9W7JL17_HIBTR|nr:DAYSLEEPER [Hibiscus trionum]